MRADFPMLLRVLLPLLMCGRLTAADPVRIVILSRYSSAIQEAQRSFEKRYGRGLIEVEAGETSVAPERLQAANAVVLHYLRGEIFESVKDPVKRLVANGGIALGIPGENAQRHWGVAHDGAFQNTAERYWTYGGAENLASFLAMLYRSAKGEKPLEVPAPAEQFHSGIYHPRAAKPFASLREYLAWYRGQNLVPAAAPLAGILFYSNNYKFRDLAHIDAMVERLEARGIGAVPVFGYPLRTLKPFLLNGDRTPLRVFLALSLGFSKSDDVEELEEYGVPVINLLTTRESVGEWMKSEKGISPERVPVQLNSPERAGANEPVLIAATEKIGGTDTTRSVPIPERVERVAERAARWIALQEKPNGEKRVAFVYYNNPPGKGYLGASYLNLMPSLVSLAERLQKEGYVTGAIPNETQLIGMLQQTGRNIEEWAPGELEAMAARGVTLLAVRKYKRWFQALPEPFRRLVLKVWGPPETSTLMTLTSRTGEKYFVIPGIRLGNLFLGPQPLRTTFDRATQVQHDTLTPPPHSYIAAYLWYRLEFRADAVVHMGRHGTLEWLPGKHVGQAGWDSSEVLLGDLPDPYYFIIDGGGEAIQARRRAAGVMIGHLTPMIVPGGAQAEYAALDQALEGYEKTVEGNPALAAEYRKQALAAIRQLQLDKQLGLNLERTEWKETFEVIHRFLHDVEGGPTPMGQQTVGTLPRDEIVREALAEFLRSGFQPAEQRELGAIFDEWAAALLSGSLPAPGAGNVKLLARVRTALAEGRTWIDNLRQSPQRELEALVGVLSGRYLVSGLLGDPLRNPASIPSGRNLHDFDTALIPTRAAWELGKRMAAQTVARFISQSGKPPEKVSMVLWYGETGRSHGAMESEALALMGVEPRWNSRGMVDGLRLIPDRELGRPRVDVVFTISGIYRDGFGDKLLWLDRASKLAASAGDNVIRRNTQRVAAALQRAGVAAEAAEKAARARVFGAAPGMYGVGGVGQIVSQSKDEGTEKGLGEMYRHHMNHIYSEELWGSEAGQALSEQLKGNQAIIHSRTTNVYGVLDNDDFYQFVGGLNAASKSVNGAAPQIYVNNLRRRGSESVEDFRTFLVKEMSTRYWNPKWIREQQRAGYAGARQFIKEMEHLYGWQATSKEQVDGSLWQKSFDVYVADRHGLGMDEFFERVNPHVRQWQLARMLEVDRQGSYRFSDADRGALIKRYVESVNKHGAACSSNTCGNARLHSYIAAQAALVTGLGSQDLKTFGRQMAAATRWGTGAFRNTPAAFRAGLREASRARGEATLSRVSKSVGPATVSGRVIREVKIAQARATPAGGTSFSAGMGLLVLVGLGAMREWVRRRG